ncbi:GTP cyclohydrolase I PLUS perhaps regulatory protein [Legionella nautarum]|uniref:NADPH-dependent 7-cyano-7-deazaguanine reductase n=1 Tax=Legionella nautarum TaxID=45070 RepID=A0A0W0WN97_9GAMM|nr:NADPH-dependent 7-cyano-7-deazaguanine reductase QueF [Legionella nautarum]KTD33790.1 GTP cyclohydrolase I PLUS perhaps regulatory protein [Legionella nautarum]
MKEENDSLLGKSTVYEPYYNPEQLFSISRRAQREELGISSTPPFFGCDKWNHYELSWLNEKGKPIFALAEIIYSCHSPFLIESKSLKLYFNSFNNTKFASSEAVQRQIINDLEKKIAAKVIVKINPFHGEEIQPFEGICLDELDVACSIYTVDPLLLTVEKALVKEQLYSNLLKSNCLVTNQPDWASVQIIYSGKKINHAGLLRYLVSFRNHNEFAEHCIERIFMDIMRFCKPEELTVFGRYSRRGGLAINPLRTTKKSYY